MKLLVRPNSMQGKLTLTLNDGTLIPYQLYSHLHIAETTDPTIACQFRFLIDSRLAHPVKYNRKTKELSYNGKLLDVENITIRDSTITEVQFGTVDCTIKDIIVDLKAV